MRSQYLAAAVIVAAMAMATSCKDEQRLYATEGDQPAAPVQEQTTGMMGELPPGHPPLFDPSQLPPGHPPLAGTMEGGMPDVTAPPEDRPRLGADTPVRPIEIQGVTMALPQSWEATQPASSMRVAQYRIPAAEGSTEGEAIVFYFGPNEGGDAMSNVVRWIGQMGLDEGFEPVVYQLKSGGLTITEVYAEGTLMPSGMGSGPTAPVAGSALYGVVVEGGPQGSLFIKVTGGAATLQEQMPAFASLIDSLAVVAP